MIKSVLRLNVCKEYFLAIKEGIKKEEYRLVKPYWYKRLKGEYDEVHILCGYPKKGDMSRTIVFPYKGWTTKTIIHPHFGESPVDVYAIRLEDRK